MTNITPTVHQLSSHEDILDALESVARRLGLQHRIESGKILLDAFYAGDARAYESRDNTKDTRFRDFVARHADALERFGWSETTARDAIRCWIVFQTLPDQVRQSLFYSQVVELTRIRDATLRTKVAIGCIQHDASVRQLRAAVRRALAGADADAIWVEPDPGADVDAPAVVTQSGRLPSKVGGWIAEVERWTAAWHERPARSLTRQQRSELAATLAALEAKVAALRAAVHPPMR